MPEDHADFVAAAAENGEAGVSDGSLQWASRQTAVVLHLADNRLDGAAPPQEFGNGPGDAAQGTADEDLHILDAVAPISAVDKGHFRPLVGEDFNLLQRLTQGEEV